MFLILGSRILSFEKELNLALFIRARLRINCAGKREQIIKIIDQPTLRGCLWWWWWWRRAFSAAAAAHNQRLNMFGVNECMLFGMQYACLGCKIRATNIRTICSK